MKGIVDETGAVHGGCNLGRYRSWYFVKCENDM